MKKYTINIAKEYSRTPGPRYEVEGQFSGEVFRKTIFAPIIKKAIEEGCKVEINLDGTAGYGTSFIEEIFGGLIREDKLKYADIKRQLIVISTEEEYLKEDVEENLKEANEKSGYAC